METLVVILARALILSFVLCCVFSGMIQVFAWSRHAREGATVSLRALRHPEGYFDAIGQRQMGVARALLVLG
ncbi:MAG TPA: hypothetical protein VFI96_07950, partial [Longimicrobiaceae bacterium]|nr:hypothetical protein [Longimicrobiaceae bacterium]